eukprot:14873571-Ditylum_brightwellii.AAC.1
MPMMYLAMAVMPLIKMCRLTQEQINSPFHRAIIQPPQMVTTMPTHHIALNLRVAAHLPAMHIITTTTPHNTMMPAAITTLLEE